MSKQLVSGKHRLRNTYWSLVGAVSATILSVQPVMAETIWDRFSTIMRDIYGQLVGISTIVAVTVAAIALLVRMVSRNQRAVDEATSWLKRVVVTWIIRRHERGVLIMISFQNVSFTYAESGNGGVLDLNLIIRSGECVLLCGPSGCGKQQLHGSQTD